VVFGSAAAPLITSVVAANFGNNFRTAFLILMPIAFLGAACLMLARSHIEKDAAKVFEAVVMAMAAQQAEEARYAARAAVEAAPPAGDTPVVTGEPPG
jgi:hypothetical protein